MTDALRFRLLRVDGFTRGLRSRPDITAREVSILECIQALVDGREMPKEHLPKPIGQWVEAKRPECPFYEGDHRFHPWGLYGEGGRCDCGAFER